jgi:hypothetical protein
MFVIFDDKTKVFYLSISFLGQEEGLAPALAKFGIT